MVLEFHVLLRVLESDFWREKNYLPQKWGKWTKNSVFRIYWKILSLIFPEFGQ